MANKMVKRTEVGSLQSAKKIIEAVASELNGFEDHWITLPEVARIFDMTEDAVRMAIHRGVFPVPSKTVLGRRIFRIDDVHKHISRPYLDALEKLNEVKDDALPLAFGEKR